MFESSDSFTQWILDIPDDRPSLPPVDEEVSGLRDLQVTDPPQLGRVLTSLSSSSLSIPTDLQIGSGSGLLLGPDDACHHVAAADSFHATTLSPESLQNATFPIDVSVVGSFIIDMDVDENMHQSSPSLATFFPPALSPDSSPISVASPWLMTPATDPSLVDIAGLTPVDSPWDIDIGETEGSCSTTFFIDQSGNSLGDPFGPQDVRLEDIACSPQVISDALLPPVLAATSCTPPFNNPGFVISHPVASASHQTGPLRQTHCTSFSPSSPYISQSLFGFSPYSMSPSLSPLTTISFFSQSPNVSPLVNSSPLSPAFSSMLLADDPQVEMAASMSSRSTRLVDRKRGADTLDEDTPPYKKARRTKARNIDEEEWSPECERVKGLRSASSSQATRDMVTASPNYPPDEGSDCPPSQGSAGHSDAIPTTCQTCGQAFTRTSDYVRHIQNSASHPETRKVWPCPYCDKKLGRKDALGRHIKTLHHGKSILIPESISGSQFSEGQKEQRMGLRKMSSRRQPRKGSREYR